ncbi:hypothetical protein JOF58_005206 [Streptomyces cinnamonensis]|nr:hypothetical protein [Streptomyces virginiae]
MTNITRERFGNALGQNHSFRGSACDTSPPHLGKRSGFL